MDQLSHDGGELQDGVAGGYEHQGIAEALAAFGAVSDVWWHAPLLTLFALRSFSVPQDIVRLPLCLVLRETDQMRLRLLVLSLFDCSYIYVQATSQSSLAELFAQTDDTLAMDLTSAGEGIAPFTRRYALARSIPDNFIAIKEDKSIHPVSIYGESVFILPDHAAAYIGPNSVALDLIKRDASPSININGLKTLRARLAMLARSMEVEVPEAILPALPFMDGPTVRGFLVLVALARQADVLCPRGRFEASVQEALAETSARTKQTVPSSRRRGVLCNLILDILDDPEHKPEGPRGGYREDLLAVHIRLADPEMFADFDQTALGKELFRLGIGTSGRHVYPGPKCGPSRLWRTYVVFSDVDRVKLRTEARDELQG